MLKLTYATFGREPPQGLNEPRYVVVHLGCALFLAVAWAATIVLNAISIPFAGTLIRFIGRPKVEYRFLRLFGQAPIIVLAGVAFAPLAIWRQSQGIWWTVGVVLALWALGIVLLLLVGVWNRAVSK